MHPHNAAFSRAPQARRLEGFVMLAALPQGQMVIDALNLQAKLGGTSYLNLACFTFLVLH